MEKMVSRFQSSEKEESCAFLLAIPVLKVFYLDHNIEAEKADLSFTFHDYICKVFLKVNKLLIKD
jgi:hypothetical protein